jgi:hypothetical protein
MLGSKPIPENFCKGTPESLSYLKAALGIESARDGTHCGSETYDFSKWIGGVSFERAVGGLRGQGISTRNGGAPVILQLRNFGIENGPNHPGNAGAGILQTQGGVAANRYDTRKMDAVLMIVVFSVDIVCRTGSVEVRE